MKNNYKAFKLMLPLLCVILFCTGESFIQTGLTPFYITGYAQGTTYHITYYAVDSVVSKQNIDDLLNKIDSSLSVYKPYSLISKFNEPGCEEVTMDKYLSDVVKKSLEIYKETNGIFDITVYPLVRAWGFGNKQIKVLPNSTAIKAIMPFIGSNKLLVSHNKLIKRVPGVQIDVDGIAQGYSADVLADYFDKKRLKNYMIEIGGELRVKGKKQPENVMMRVGIEGPAKNAEDEPFLQRVIEFGDGGITTSGNYRKYFKSGNKILSHLIDPATGYPLQNEMIAVTVIAKDAITADGYDNPLMGMGLKKALLFLQHHKSMDAYFIYHKPDGSIADTATSGFYKHLIIGQKYKAPGLQ